ncbi:MAG: hypothetical protein ACT4OJ_16320 [Bacteroidota bacterium]
MSHYQDYEEIFFHAFYRTENYHTLVNRKYPQQGISIPFIIMEGNTEGQATLQQFSSRTCYLCAD